MCNNNLFIQIKEVVGEKFAIDNPEKVELRYDDKFVIVDNMAENMVSAYVRCLQDLLEKDESYHKTNYYLTFFV